MSLLKMCLHSNLWNLWMWLTCEKEPLQMLFKNLKWDHRRISNRTKYNNNQCECICNFMCSLDRNTKHRQGKGERAYFSDNFKATDHHGREENVVGIALTVVVVTWGGRLLVIITADTSWSRNPESNLGSKVGAIFRVGHVSSTSTTETYFFMVVHLPRVAQLETKCSNVCG